MPRTSDFLVESVLLSTFSPDASDITTAQMLAWGDEVVESLVAATIRPGREGYWLTHEDIPVIPGQVEYAVPRRAMARGLRGLMAVTPEGRTYPLTPADPLELRRVWESATPVAYDPAWYSFEDQTIRVNAVSSSAGWSLRAFYLLAPPRLIEVASGAEVLANVPAGTSDIECAATPPTTVSTVGAFVDVVAGIAPYPTIVRSASVDAFSDPVVTLAEPVSVPIDGQQLNRESSYLVPEGTTVYPPIVGALWPALVEGTAAKMLEALRDPSAAAMRDRAEASRQRAVVILEPRDNRRAPSVVGESALRTSRVRRGFGRGWW